MYSFIKEFYYGNIEPGVRRYEPGTECAKAADKVAENEDKLLKLLTGEAKKLFSEYIKSSGVLLCESETAAFIDGFRIGAHFAFDAFVSTENAVQPIGDGLY